MCQLIPTGIVRRGIILEPPARPYDLNPLLETAGMSVAFWDGLLKIVSDICGYRAASQRAGSTGGLDASSMSVRCRIKSNVGETAFMIPAPSIGPTFGTFQTSILWRTGSIQPSQKA
jgi:hypothetical protein